MRSYHLPFVVAAVCIVALAVVANTSFGNPHRAVWLSVITAILILDVPIAVWVIWHWYRTGEPPQFDSNLLGESPGTRAMWRLWRERPQLDDEAFYQTFYADSDVPKDVVIAVRREWISSIYGKEAIGMYPGDNLGVAAPELDFADVLYRMEKELHVVIPWQTCKIDFDFTFDSLIRLVADCKDNKYPVPPASDRRGFGIRGRYLPFILAAVCLFIVAITSNLYAGDVSIWVIAPTVTILLITLPACLRILCRV